MALRVTHQWADVLRAGSADVRVTRQYVEVIVAPNLFEEVCAETVTVTDACSTGFVSTVITESITISELAYAALTHNESVSESITISDTIVAEHIPDIYTLSETIVLADIADAELNGVSIFSRDLIETIIVSDAAVADNNTKSGVCIESLLIADSARASGSTSHTIIEHFFPSDYNAKTVYTTDPTTGQLVPIGYVDDSSIQDSNTHEWIPGTKNIREAIVVDDFAKGHLIVAVGDHEEVCTESITVTDVASDTDHLGFCTEDITVTDTAVPEVSLLIIENITVTDSIDLEIITNKTITETIDVNEILAYELVSGISLCTYHPFIGGASDPAIPTAPSTTPPTETLQTDFQFYYPVIGPTDTLTLTGPESDDQEKLHFQRINRTSRGLSLHIYADPQWPKVRRLNIGVDVCTEVKAQEVLDFVELTLGQEIGLRDWHNRNWKGIIDNPQNVITRVKRNSYTIAIEFEAEITEI